MQRNLPVLRLHWSEILLVWIKFIVVSVASVLLKRKKYLWKTIKFYLLFLCYSKWNKIDLTFEFGLILTKMKIFKTALRWKYYCQKWNKFVDEKYRKYPVVRTSHWSTFKFAIRDWLFLRWYSLISYIGGCL